MEYRLVDIETRLHDLSAAGKLCFGFVSAERCLGECRHLPSGEALHVPLLKSVVSHCREKIQKRDFEYGSDLEAMHQEVSELIPEADTESPPPKIQTRAAYAVCELCMMFKAPHEAARYGSLIGAEIVHIRSNIYSKGPTLDEREFGLQLDLLKRISDAGSASALQILQSLTFEDYECGEYIGWDE